VPHAGAGKKDGVPVLDNVEEIFRAINPDLPIPANDDSPLARKQHFHCFLEGCVEPRSTS